MASGIYILTFKGTDKVYIGQSKYLTTRYMQHKSLFKANKASNKMQAAYNTYGMPEFFILLECCIDDLDKQEALFIQEFDSVENGFNTRSSPTGGGISLWGDLNGRSKYSNDQIISSMFLLLKEPKLTYQEISSETKVHKATLCDISNGTGHKWLKDLFPEEYIKLLSYRHKRNTRFYLSVTSPEGIVHNVENLSRFCEKYNLDTGNMSKLLTGKRKSYLGWKPLPVEKI